MTHTIIISDNLFAKIESLAKPFVDKEPSDVIKRLVEQQTDHGSLQNHKNEHLNSYKEMATRAPRERGATIDLNGSVIKVDSVPDLCRQVMEYLSSNGYWEQTLKFTPYKTSSKRYLFSKSPKHPNGKDFFVPIKHRNLYMESHKNYETAIKQLSKFLDRCGIKLTYQGI